MFSLSLLSLALLPCALAAPRPDPYADPIHIPIVRRSTTVQDRVANLPQVMDSIRLKYGYRPINQKRSTTSVAITDEVRFFQIFPASYSHISPCRKTIPAIPPSLASGHRTYPHQIPLLPHQLLCSAQQFNLILDTGKSFIRPSPRFSSHPPLGSSDLWVATDQCTTCTSNVPLFNPSKSSTYKNDSSTIQITYGSGAVAGYVSQDTVNFAGFSMNQELRP